jgi:hypothetical protein
LHEIGRLREVTFREVGEEQMNPLIWISLTNTTTIYSWDEDAKKIAGAYRMGLSSEIY